MLVKSWTPKFRVSKRCQNLVQRYFLSLPWLPILEYYIYEFLSPSEHWKLCFYRPEIIVKSTCLNTCKTMFLLNKNCQTLTGHNSMNLNCSFKSWWCLTIYMNWAVKNFYNNWFFVLNSMCNLRLKIINFGKILGHPKFRGSKQG